jgi:hypothetical protein
MRIRIQQLKLMRIRIRIRIRNPGRELTECGLEFEIRYWLKLKIKDLPIYQVYLFFFYAGKMVESKKALPKEPRLGGLDCSPPHSRALDSSPPHSRALDNSLHLYTSLHGFHRHGVSSVSMSDLHSFCANPDTVLLPRKSSTFFKM